MWLSDGAEVDAGSCIPPKDTEWCTVEQQQCQSKQTGCMVLTNRQAPPHTGWLGIFIVVILSLDVVGGLWTL